MKGISPKEGQKNLRRSIFVQWSFGRMEDILLTRPQINNRRWGGHVEQLTVISGGRLTLQMAAVVPSDVVPYPDQLLVGNSC